MLVYSYSMGYSGDILLWAGTQILIGYILPVIMVFFYKYP